jgi:hypothetical protein
MVKHAKPDPIDEAWKKYEAERDKPTPTPTPFPLTPVAEPEQNGGSFFGNLLNILAVPGEAILGGIHGLKKSPFTPGSLLGLLGIVPGGLHGVEKFPFTPASLVGKGEDFLLGLIGMGPQERDAFAARNAEAWAIMTANDPDVAFFDLKTKLEQLGDLAQERPGIEQAISITSEVIAGIGGAKLGAKGIKTIAGRGIKAIAGRGVDEAVAPVTALADQPQVVQKLAQEIPKLERMEPITGQARREVLAGRAAEARTAFDDLVAWEGGPTEAVMKRALSKFKGELPKRPTFTPLVDVLEPQDVMDLRQIVIDASGGDVFEIINNWKALDELFFGRLPQKAQIDRLKTLFGPEVAEEILKKRSGGAVAWETFLDIVNIPKTFVSSFDLSAPLRQGALLAPGHPKQFGAAFGAMFKTVFKPENAKFVDEAIRSHHLFEFAEDVGLFYDPSLMGKAIGLSGREEAFMSRLATKIPGVGWSQRMYSTFLNKFRHDVFYNIADDWMKAGKNYEEFQELARWINWATGRGPSIGPQALQGLMNAAAFSPRFATSRLMMPVELARILTPQSIAGHAIPGQQGMTMAVRGLIAKDLVAAVSTGFMIQRLFKLALGDEVELEEDPRSPDFGKIKYGDIRYDYWGGMQPVARYTANLILQQRKTSSGDLQDVDTIETLTRYLRSKGSPPAGLAYDILSGTTFAGEQMTMEPGFIAEQAFQRFIPLFIQDVVEAIASMSIDGGLATVPGNITEDPVGAIGKLLAASPGLLGVGIQSYKSFHDIRDAVSMEQYRVPYESLTDPSTQLPGGITGIDAKSEVRNDPRVVKYLEARGADVSRLSPEEDLREGYIRLKRINLELEKDFVPKLKLKGGDLRKAIQTLKSARFQVADKMFSPEAQALQGAGEPANLTDALRNEYWEIQVPEDIVNGRLFLDFDARDQQQQVILRRADAAGIARQEIVDRPSDRFTNPEIRRVVEEFEQDMDTLRRYFGEYKKVIRDPRMQMEYRTVPESQWDIKIKRMIPQVERLRLLMRCRTRGRLGGIESLLQKWEFVTTPPDCTKLQSSRK